MRTSIFTLFAICSLLFCAGCTKEDNIEPSIIVPKTELTFDENSQIATFQFETNSSWTISINYNGENTDWIDLDPTSGYAGDITINAMIEENDKYEERIAYINIQSSTVSSIIAVTQAEKPDPTLSLTEDNTTVSSKSGSFTLGIYSNTNWSVENLPSWISASSSSGFKDSQITIYYNENLDTAIRESTFNIVAGGLDESFIITQEAAKEYSQWDGSTLTEPSDLDVVNKTMTIMLASDLAWVADKANTTNDYDCFAGFKIILGANLDLGGVQSGTSWSGKKWTPIGYREIYSANYPFKGEFDGNGFVIKNIYINESTKIVSGLFGYCSEAVIKNVIIESGSIGNYSQQSYTHPIYIGSICGYLADSEIYNCQNYAEIESKISVYSTCSNSSSHHSYIGGICGYANSGSKLSYCENWGELTSIIMSYYAYTYNKNSFSYTGGICGYNESSTPVSNCVNNGDMYSNVRLCLGYKPTYYVHSYAGGISGYCSRGASYSNCENNGEIEAESGSVDFGLYYSNAYAGGILGYSYDVTITDCNNRGNIISSAYNNLSYSGGICGYSGQGTIEDSNNFSKVNSGYYANGIAVGGSSLSILNCNNYGEVTIEE